MSDAAHLPFRARLHSAVRPAMLAALIACGDSTTGLVDKVTPTVNPASAIALMTPFDAASPLERASGDSQPSVVAIQLRDAAGQPVKQAGRLITLSVLEPGGAPSTGIQILRGGTTPTDTAGLARIFGLVLAGRAGDAVLSAKVDTLPALNFPIRLKAGAISASASAVTVAPDTVPVGGVAQVVVVPMDASGNKRGPDQQVTALLDGNQALATVSTFTYSATDSSYRGSITVNAVSAARALRANVNGVALTVAPPFTGIAAVTPPVPATALRFAVLPGDTTGSYRTLSGAVWPSTTVQLVDASGNAVRQAGVAITGRATTTTGGTLANATLLNAGPVSTNASGQAVFPGMSLTAPAGAARVRFEATNLTATSLPVQIVPGVVSTTISTLTVTRDSVLVDSTVTIKVIPRDAAGSALGSGQTVALTTTGGTSTGTLSAVTYNAADSSYRATFTGTAAGSFTTLRATVNGSQLVASLNLTVIVPPGLVVASSPVTLTPDTIGVAGVAQLVATPLNGAGKKLGAGQTVTVALAGGTSVATVGTPTYSAADSSYRVSITGTTVGTTTTATTTVNGVVLTATRPLTVSASPPPADPATNLRITVLPGDTTAGGLLVGSGALLNGVTISLRSASGNPVAQSGVPITVTAVTSSGAAWAGATVTGGGPLSTTSDGTIVFPSLRIAAPVGSGRLRFSANGLTAASFPVRVTAGAVSSTVSTFTLSPDTVAVGAASAAIVTLRDAQNNKIGSGQTVTFALGATGTSTITVGATTFTAGDSTYRASLSGYRGRNVAHRDGECRRRRDHADTPLDGGDRGQR